MFNLNNQETKATQIKYYKIDSLNLGNGQFKLKYPIISNTNSIPRFLYKYMEYKWATELVRTGSIRTTELHQYQKPDFIDDIHDLEQGKKANILTNSIILKGNEIDNHPVIGKNYGIGMSCGGNQDITLTFVGSGALATRKVISSNALSLCLTSTMNNWNLAKKISRNYDTCVGIDLIRFSQIIGKHLTKISGSEIPFIRLYEISYSGRNESRPEYYHQDPDTYGSTDQSYQKEWRLLFSCQEASKNFHDIIDNKITDFTKITGSVFSPYVNKLPMKQFWKI